MAKRNLVRGFTLFERPGHKLKGVSESERLAFTLVELLVVIAIIGVLVALLLPAIQSAREAARRSQCISNLKQLGVACQLHHDTHGFFPSGGWGDWWVGCPDMGAGENQPGNWAYQLLPFIEESAAAGLGSGFKCTDPNSRAILGQMVATPVSIFYCPTRRAVDAYPMGARDYPNIDEPARCAKSDYAGNIGDHFTATGSHDELRTLAQAADPTWDWEFSGPVAIARIRTNLDRKFQGQTGTIFQRSEIQMKQITDGTSKTYLLGEKNVPANHYDDGIPNNDDQSMYNGYDQDNLRSTFVWFAGFENSGPPQTPPKPDSDTVMVPPPNGGAEQQRPSNDRWAFGGPHPSGWVALFCDGSVRFLGFDINPTLHQNYGNRRDGNVTE
jgi:prepilin-type N-terminal cleavage/methylation domain-containing protein